MSPRQIFRCAIGCLLLLGSEGYAALPGDDNWDNRFGLPCDNAIYAMAVSGSSVYVGGYFTTIGGIGANRIARWDGTNWSALGDGIGGSGAVYALAVSENNLYVGGAFTLAGGQAVCNVARWDGTNWFAVGTNAPAVVALAARGGEVFIGHTLSNVALGPYLARWNGSNWVSLGGGITAAAGLEGIRPVRSILVRGPDVYIGGQFSQVGAGTRATNIARWDGSQWYPLGGGVEYRVPYSTNTYTVASMVSSGADLYVCGNFTRAGGQNITNIARWNGVTWAQVGSNYWSLLNAIAVSGPEVFAGGNIPLYIDGVTKGVTRWDGSTWSPLGSGVDGVVYALGIIGSDLFVAGKFSTAGGKASPNFAVWHNMPKLQFERLNTSSMRLSWPTQFTSLLLESTTNIFPANWITSTQTAGIYNSQFAVTNKFLKKQEYFRLRRP